MRMSWKCLHCDQIAAPQEVGHSPFRMNDGANQYLEHLITRTCPNPECGRTDLILRESYLDTRVVTREIQVLPPSRARQRYARYVPPAIFSDYQEACAVEDRSTKAAAALTRRAMQAVLREFYERKEPKLYAAIDKLKGEIDPTLWEALDATRKWGNVAAHPDEEILEIEPERVRKLLLVLEQLFEESYVRKAERDALLRDVADSI